MTAMELHQHHRIAGAGERLAAHAHDDGSEPHGHPEHGPASFRGSKPIKATSGPQMPHEPTETTFRVVVHEGSLRRYHADRAAEGYGPVQGGAIPTIQRLEQVFHLRAVVERGDA